MSPETRAAPSPSTPTPTLAAASRVWLRIGLLGFGGPAGQIALMHGELVERRGWIEEEQFLAALNYCMLIPGPEAQQLATYVGWLMHGFRGAFVAGGLFVLPGALVILGLAALYTSFHHLPALAALFFGLKAAVLAVVWEALHRMSRRTLHGPIRVAIALSSFAALTLADAPFPFVVLAAGLVGALLLRPKGEATETARAAPRSSSLSHLARVVTGTALAWGLPYALLVATFGRGNVFVAEALFFTKVGSLTFGGAYAVLSYVAQQAVSVHGWLLPGEMLDGLGLAETTPGPLLLVLLFVGYVGAHRVASSSGLLGSPALAGCLGGAVTLWATFVPAFFWILVGAPWVENLRRKPALGAALSGVSAAVVGVILNLAVWFGLHVLFERTTLHQSHGLHWTAPVLGSLDFRAAALTALAAFLLFRTSWGMARTLAVCAAGGLALALTR